jgi:hypothetical protein
MCGRIGEYHVQMPDIVATNIIVFGRGLVTDDSGFRLTRASAERVKALTAYVRQNEAVFNTRHGRIVFSGGWAAAADGIERPPSQFREGSLMLDRAQEAGIGSESLARYAEAVAEIESDSTLENVLRTKEAGYFRGVSFSADNPLGLVAHEAHLIRIDYLVRKIYGLPRNAILHVVAAGHDNFSGGFREDRLLFITRIALLGARGHDSLRHRHQLLVTSRHWLRALYTRAHRS